MNRLPNTTARAQAGVMLLEALIGILIFSLGILSLVALQATSIQLTSDAKYRTDASLLANRLIGQMWASGLAPAVLKTKFENGGDQYNAWLPMCRG
jgi:type IV pilus assembly protein PilV